MNKNLPVSGSRSLSDNLAQYINRMAHADVLVIGDIMLDRFVYGSVDRISPESPVPVLAVQRENQMLGGAGNALTNLYGLNAKARIISVIGADGEGHAIKERIARMGYDPASLVEDPHRPTTVKTRFLCGHQQLLRSDFEKKEPIAEAVEAQVLKHVKQALPAVQAVIVSDYGKGLLTPGLLSTIMEEARRQGVPVIVDPKGQDFSIYRGATAVTPNKKELSDATQGAPVQKDGEIEAAARRIIDTCGIEAVIATRSKDGMSVIHKHKDPIHIAGADIEVYDVSGAGDTVIATIAAAIAAGASMAEAAALANLAGGVVVTKVGTAPIRAEELGKVLQSEESEWLTAVRGMAGTTHSPRQPRIMSWKEAEEQVQRWRARGLKIGFTNGCFDILHFGHVSYLNEARDLCDRLIVGLNHDKSVSILKGPERPVHDEISRASVLGALGSVDMVVLFGATEEGGDNTAIKLLELLKPDIYFKGGDYTADQIPEAPTVLKAGGKVEIMPVQDGHSTSGSIAKMRRPAA